METEGSVTQEADMILRRMWSDESLSTAQTIRAMAASHHGRRVGSLSCSSGSSTGLKKEIARLRRAGVPL